MDKERVKIYLDLLVIVCMFVVAIILIVFLITVLTDGGSCVLNPAGYYSKVNNISNICEHCKQTMGGNLIKWDS